MENPNDFVRINMRRLRKAKGWRQEDLAAETGFALITIWRYESGKRDPGSEDVRIIAQALGTSVSELYKDPDEKPEPQRIFQLSEFELKKLIREAANGPFTSQRPPRILRSEVSAQDILLALTNVLGNVDNDTVVKSINLVIDYLSSKGVDISSLEGLFLPPDKSKNIKS